LITLKILPPLPGLSWVKKAPAPLLAIESQTQTSRNTGLMMTNPINDKEISRKRLKNSLYMYQVKYRLVFYFILASNEIMSFSKRLLRS
jgi:hypothetical protein